MTHVFKCKMCGGVLSVEPGMTVCECEYCGAVQTLPRLDSERKASMYDRADHFRRSNDFDKAMGVYEMILNEDPDDAEAYWSLVLCRYGIEYVEDPKTHKRIPTVNRAQYTSIFLDEDYKAAIEHADDAQRKIYEQEAQAIDTIQKGILEISRKEEPFDVFICYKETDENGRRTPDSVYAYDLYKALTQEGYKVFFSRVTLEDKLGEAYEPYIFAALNSAKVMIVVGTKPEYFNAVWVKNEWSRFLTLVKNSDGKKILIPAYKDMNPYDLPEEFSYLQAQDMGKLGYMQDMIRGIEKLIKPAKSKPETIGTEKTTGVASTAESLLKRAYLSMEEADWAKADDYCEQILDSNPEYAEAWLAKLLCEQKITDINDLRNLNPSFENSANYQRVLRFGSTELKDTVKQAVELAKENQAERKRLDIYTDAVRKMNLRTVSGLDDAVKEFESLGSYKDAGDLLAKCRKQLAVQREASNAKKKKGALVTGVLAAVVAAVSLYLFVLRPSMTYNQAIAAMERQDYEEAYTILSGLNGYKDSDELMNKCRIYDLLDKCIAAVEDNDTIEASTQLGFLEKRVTVGDYDEEMNTIVNAALAAENANVAERAIALIGNQTIVDPLAIAYVNYTKLMALIIKDTQTINEADSLLKMIPDNYQDIEAFKVIYQFYKGYMGIYTRGNSELGQDSWIMLYMKEGKVYAQGNCIRSDLEFVYPSLTCSGSNDHITLDSKTQITLKSSSWHYILTKQ